MQENVTLASKFKIPEVTIITEGFSLFGLAYGIMLVQNCYPTTLQPAELSSYHVNYKTVISKKIFTWMQFLNGYVLLQLSSQDELSSISSWSSIVNQ